MTNTDTYAFTEAVRVFENPETFPALPALADRLGVKPNGDIPSRVALAMKNGDRYDLFELINAFLDKTEKS